MSELTPKEIRTGLKISVWEGSFATVHVTLTSGAFLIGYALLLGVNDFQLGLLAALPFLAQMLQPLGALLVQGLKRRKRFTLIGAAFFRGVWILLVFIPFLPLSKGHKILLFLLTVALSAVVNNLITVSWLSWMADLVPEKIRGRYFGVRNNILQIVTMGVYFGGAKFLDWCKNLKPDEINLKIFDFSGFSNLSVLGFILVFTVGVIGALIAAFLLSFQPEPSFHRYASKRGFLQDMLTPFRHKEYQRLILFFVVWSFSIGIAAPFWMPHMLRNLHLDYYVISLFSVLAGIISLISQPLWGKLIDRYGCKPVLRFNLAFIMFIPYLWFFVTPRNYSLLWLDAVMGGLFWVGFNLAIFTIVLQISPEEGKPYFLASTSFVNGLFTFLASITGGIIANHLSGFRWELFGQTLVNFHILFLVSALGRVGGLFLIRRIVEPKARPVTEMVTQLGYYFGKKVLGGEKFGKKY